MTETLPHRFEPLHIDRRRLLKTSAAITTASLAANLAPSETALVVSAQTVSTTSDTILNVSATTARRLAEIERRNELRRQAKLPTLPIAKTLRLMKEEDDNQKFSEAFGSFASKHRQAVWYEVLKTRREIEGPNWRPSFLEGMARQSEVFGILRQRFEAERTQIKRD
jgi:hypothetical protein